MKTILLLFFALSLILSQIPDTSKFHEPSFKEWFKSQVEDVENYPIKLDSSIPKWLKGDLINSCPSLLEVGKYHFENLVDGFMRFNKLRFDGNGTVFFTSKLIKDSDFYKRSMKNQCPQGVLADYPTPKRMSDYIPGMNVYEMTKHPVDNINVMPFLLPDNKTFIFTTDEIHALEFDPEDLSTKGLHQWNIQSGNIGNMKTGITHLQKDLNSDDLIGLGVAPGLKNTIVFYRIQAEDVKQKVPIGEIEIRGMGWFHSFGITKDYILFPEHPVSISIIKMIEGYPVTESYVRDASQNTIIHLMELKGEKMGSYKSFELDHANQILHFGNTYQEENIITFDVEMYAIDSNPLKQLNLDYLLNDNSGIDIGSKFRRYQLDTESGETTYIDMITLDKDGVGFPIYNEKWSGKKNCFSYITELSNHKFQTAILKVNHCDNHSITKFQQDGLFIQEPYFIADPESDEELGGLLVMTAYDSRIQESKLIIVDPISMKLVTEHGLKIRLPFGLHYNYFPNHNDN